MDKSKDPKEWLRRSKSCLKIAQSYKDEDVYLEDLCFNAQQSVEKALKALIVHLNLEVFRTHNIRVILKELRKRIVIPDNITNAIELNQYAVFTRYPDDYFEITDKEYQEAVKIAEEVFNWATESLK